MRDPVTKDIQQGPSRGYSTWLCEQQRKHVCQGRAGQGADQLEEEGKAHDKGVGGQEVLLAPDHEGSHCQVLPSWSCLGDLQPTTCFECLGWTCHVCGMQSTYCIVLTSQYKMQLEQPTWLEILDACSATNQHLCKQRRTGQCLKWSLRLLLCIFTLNRVLINVLACS